MKVILSTQNVSKAKQIAELLGDHLDLVTLEDEGISGGAIEDGSTLRENALKKALFAHEATGLWSIADDTGLFIDALDGRPGVHSARWAGNDVSTEDIMRYTLDQLKNISWKDRIARFETVAAVVSPEGDQCFFTGELNGRILITPQVPCQPKMPYSAIFLPDGCSKVLAELSIGEFNAISHRGKAFSMVRTFFQQQFQV